ncbi:MAG TPA: DUF2190 family protein [Phycisphaerae bacterium]|nr:DUF2190 family protein [Phycisphaerae bacterium]
MADNYIEAGRVLPTTNGTGSALAAGKPILVGATLRVFLVDCANGASAAATTEGVWTLDATSAEDWADGAALYWVAGTAKISDTVGANTFVGWAVGAKVALATTAQMKLAG